MPVSPGLWPSLLLQPVAEIPFQRDGTGFDASNRSREYTRKFLVMVKDKSLNAGDICFATGIPVPYSPYMSHDGKYHDFDSWLIRISAIQPDPTDWQRWIVTCNYSNAVGDIRDSFRLPETNIGSNNRPDLEPPEIAWDWEIVNKARARDLNGRPFLNSAKQPLTPTPTFEESYAILVYTRNELTYDRQTASKYAFAVNKDDFLGAKPGQAQCLPIKATQVSKGRILYWKVNYRIRFKEGYEPEFKYNPSASPNIYGQFLDLVTLVQSLVPITWQPKYLDAGLMELQKVPGQFLLPIPGNVPLPVQIPIEKAVPIHRGAGRISQPVCLDGKGHEQKPNPYTGEIKPEWLEFRVYKEEYFANLFLNGL